MDALPKLAIWVPKVVEDELNAGLVGLHVAMNELIPVDESCKFSERLFVAGKLCREPAEGKAFAETSGDLALGAGNAAWNLADFTTRLFVFR